MAEKKYQFFISSTYEDLKEERNRLFWAVLKKKHIPVGMELFGAVDEEQMSYIKRLIDDCDCYVVLLGGRYGSVDGEGISYTEREYDYAVQQRKKIIALVYKDPDSLPPEKRDSTEESRKKFKAFREKVIHAKRLVSQWKDMTDLVDNFHVSIDETIKSFPLVGWIRANLPASPEVLQRIELLETENQHFKEMLASTGGMQIATDIMMEARSVTSPSLDFGSEIECVSLVILLDMDQGLDQSLLETHDSRHPAGEIAQYYCEKAIPWFIRMAKICCFDLKITNPQPFQIERIGEESHLFDSKGNEIEFSVPTICNPPPHPLLGERGRCKEPTPPVVNINPNQSIEYKRHFYCFPRDSEVIVYKKIFTAKNIIRPIEKGIVVRFRKKVVKLNCNEIIRLIMTLQEASKFNDIGMFDFVKRVLLQEGKEQYSCDTEK